MSVTRRLGGVALLLGLGATVAGSPYKSARGKLDVEEMAHAITAGTDHVSARQLALWIKGRKPRLRVIDVRTPPEFAAYAIPTAENIPIARLPRTLFGTNEQIVLYSEGGAHAAQAWAMLRALGLRNVWFIAGGLADWRDEVIAPVLPASATPEQTKAFEEISELSRYFDGSPQVGVPGAPVLMPTTEGPAAQLAAIRRRGC